MAHPALERILALSSREEELKATVAYLTQNLAPAVKSGDAVLICFPHEQETDFGTMAGKAVKNCGGNPVFWGEDPRWKELLRLSFLWKATAIIAPPLIILGLTKLTAYKKVPLYLTHAVMAGYPCLNWFIDGVEPAGTSIDSNGCLTYKPTTAKTYTITYMFLDGTNYNTISGNYYLTVTAS